MSSVQFQQKQDGASETAQQVKVVAAVKPEDPSSYLWKLHGGTGEIVPQAL